jgi:hypothetical protein
MVFGITGAVGGQRGRYARYGPYARWHSGTPLSKTRLDAGLLKQLLHARRLPFHHLDNGQQRV